jgi:hypothetical protein
MAGFEGPSYSQQVNGNLVINDDGTGNYGKIIAAGGITVSGGGVTFAPNIPLTVNGNIDISGAGYGLEIKEGANCKQGTAVLNGTTAVVVANTSVTANSRIFLTINTPGGTPASPYVSAVSAGVSFSIKSTGASDTSTVAYLINEPG